MLVKVTLPDGVVPIELGTTICQLLVKAKRMPASTNPSPEECHTLIRQAGYVGALVYGDEVGLDYKIVSDCSIEPIMRNDYAGKHLVGRSAAFLLKHIVKRNDPSLRLVLGQSLNSRMFFEVPGCDDYLALAKRINALFQEAITDDLQFFTRPVPLGQAMQLVDDPDTRSVLHSWVGRRFDVVTLEDDTVLAFGAYLPSTAYLEGMRVIGIKEGLLLTCDDQKMPKPELANFMLRASHQAQEWNSRMKVETVGKLNDCILNGHGQTLVQVSETMHELRIGSIANEIRQRGNVKVVFISGPSSSGKTSTVRRLSTHLQAMGLETLYVGLDDYYKKRSECPKDADGLYDLESPDALNLARLHDDLHKLITGQSTEIPCFDFMTQAPKAPDPSRVMQLHEGQILMMEGIHGLNPLITDAVPREQRFGIYVSAMPQILLDPLTRVPTTYSRLLRRIIRDHRYRGTSAARTIAQWPSVRRGENNYIFANQHRADAIFNSALAYELAVFRTYAWPYLLEVPEGDPAYPLARNILAFLSLVVPMTSDWVPKNSVLREFVGGSTYIY